LIKKTCPSPDPLIGDCKDICEINKNRSNNTPSNSFSQLKSPTGFEIPAIDIESIENTRQGYCNSVSPILQGASTIASFIPVPIIQGIAVGASATDGAVCASSIKEAISNINVLLK